MSLGRSVFFTLLTALSLQVASAAQELPTGADTLAPARYLDVPTDHWAWDAIRRLSVLGVLTGYPDMNFRGSQPATRYELAVVAARLVDLIGGTLADLALDPAFWSDLEEAARLVDRLARIEAAIDNAAALEYVESLERRIAHVEAYLNESIGEERFPLEEPGSFEPARSAAEAAPILPADGSGAATRRSESGGENGSVGQDEAIRAGFESDQAFGVTSGQRRPLDWWIGMAAGYPNSANVHVGIRDLWPAFHVRVGAGFSAAGSYGLELLALYSLPSAFDSPVLPYLAAGPALRGGAGTASAGVLALAGIEIPLGRDFQVPGFVYAELGPEVMLFQGAGTGGPAAGSGASFGVSGRVGLGYRF